MKNERIAILRMVSEAKITICEADSLLQALKGTHKRARSNQRHIGNWGGKALQTLKPFAKTAKKHLYAVKTDSVEKPKETCARPEAHLESNPPGVDPRVSNYYLSVSTLKLPTLAGRSRKSSSFLYIPPLPIHITKSKRRYEPWVN